MLANVACESMLFQKKKKKKIPSKSLRKQNAPKHEILNNIYDTEAFFFLVFHFRCDTFLCGSHATEQNVRSWWQVQEHFHLNLDLSYASAAATTKMTMTTMATTTALLIVKYKRIDDIKYVWMYILCDYE